MKYMDKERRHIKPVESSEPSSVAKSDEEVEELEFLIRTQMRSAVEDKDRNKRKERISDLYTIGSSAGLDAETLNSWYQDALSLLKRPRGFSDEIEYATSTVTGERIQVWPPIPEQIEELGHQALRHAIRAINQSQPEESRNKQRRN
jgi:hypothetical protein